ncbi:MAG TPA: magnesium transporter [Oligoflexus sp.]|uniref:magnesium transporter n=1 Tax=Oligoflexus sp. TaxID=1971216 RepID=UPI002D7EB582|nr:magnesium transporter [Oligoflexus sp.]HET9241197.1 magnesium transporter [Oligoflexus sp.]
MIRLDETQNEKQLQDSDALRETWADLSAEDRLNAFMNLERAAAEDFFLTLKTDEQAELLVSLPVFERRFWLRILPPDDLADLIQEFEPELRYAMLAELDPRLGKEVAALLAYAEDQAGGLMNPRFARIRPDMQVGEALRYLRKQAHENLENLRFIYVLDRDQKLLGAVSLREIFLAPDQKLVQDIMRTNLVVANENMDQEALKQLFASHGLMAIPIVDSAGRMKGIVTADDIVEVVEEEATEDIQRMAGVEALDAPYLKIDLASMIKKRGGWLVILFFGEMFTATAMSYFEHELERALVLALFIPLIISSGGNSGSQASTLVVRAMALGEVRLRDWSKVLGREIVVGAALGLILGSFGLLRIIFWPNRDTVYGEHFFLVGLSVAVSLVGVVLWGSLSGSMLPFVLRKCKLDPATASAPFVATLVDVCGLIIYFTTASLILRGTLL